MPVKIILFVVGVLGALAAASAAVLPANAQKLRSGIGHTVGYNLDYADDDPAPRGIRFGFGHTAFPIPGAVPAGTPYDPYRLPYTYSWPYGYGYISR